MVQRPPGGPVGGPGGGTGGPGAGGSQPGWAGAAQQAATRYYTGLHTSLLSKLTAQASGNARTNVYVTVSGPLGYSVFGFFGLDLTISATAGGPVECFRPPGAHGCG